MTWITDPEMAIIDAANLPLRDHELDAARAYVIDGTHDLAHVVMACDHSMIRAARAIDIVRCAVVLGRVA